MGNGAGPDTSPAYDVTVTDALPAGLAAPTNISDGGTFAAGGSGAGTITWLVAGPVAPGSSVSLTYTATLAASETLTPGQALVNTASVTQYFDSQDASGGDPSRYITYAPVPPALTATASVTPQFPALTIAKTTSTGASSGIAVKFRKNDPGQWDPGLEGLGHFTGRLAGGGVGDKEGFLRFKLRGDTLQLGQQLLVGIQSTGRIKD